MRRLVFILYLTFAFLCAAFVSSNALGAMLHRPQILGTHQVLGGFYGPFAILRWYWSIRVSGHLYTEAFFLFLAVFFTLSTLGYRLYVRLRVNVIGMHGSSRWMTRTELARSGALTSEGIVLGQTAEARYTKKRLARNRTRDDGRPPVGHTGGMQRGAEYRYRMRRRGRIIFSRTEGHVLVIAPTGGGKNVSVVSPTLLSWLGSAVVYDVKNESFAITSGWRREFSYVYRFEPADPEHSVHFNPLFEIEKGEGEVAQVQNLAEILVNPHGDGEYSSREDAHWKLTAKQLLVGAILHVLYSADCPDKSLRGVYTLLNDPDRPIRDTLAAMNAADHFSSEYDRRKPQGLSMTSEGPPRLPRTHPVVAEAARNMMNKADNELSGVVSTASSYLQLYQDPIVAENTRTSDFRIAELTGRAHPCTLYICVPPGDSSRMQPLVRLVFQMIAGSLTARLGENRHSMLFALDEFPTLGRMGFFEKELAFFRGYNIRLLIVAQSFGQLFEAYGRSTSIIDNCAEIAVLGVGHQDAKLVSGFLGSRSISRENQSRSRSIGSFFEWTHTTSASEGGRPLMTDDELARMPYEEFILISHGRHPYKGKKILYYQDPRFARRATRKTITKREEQRLEFLESYRNGRKGVGDGKLYSPQRIDRKVAASSVGPGSEASDHEASKGVIDVLPQTATMIEDDRQESTTTSPKRFPRRFHDGEADTSESDRTPGDEEPDEPGAEQGENMPSVNELFPG